MSRGIKLGSSGVVGGGGNSSSRLIVNTTNLLVGDIIRVRSTLDPTTIYNEEVETIGTPIVFDIPSKDIYKISLVQEVEDDGDTTEVERYVTEKTCGDGDCFKIDTFNKTTLAGIQGILNAHAENELLSVGDIVTIKVGGSDWDMQIAAIDLYNNHEVIFVSKNIWIYSAWNTSAVQISYESSTIRSAVLPFYTSMTDEDKQYLKLMTRTYDRLGASNQDVVSDKVWIPTWSELNGDSGVGPVGRLQLPLFTTPSSRIKTYNGTVSNWWSSDNTSNSAGYATFVNTIGTGNNDNKSGVTGVVPGFQMLADF